MMAGIPGGFAAYGLPGTGRRGDRGKPPTIVFDNIGSLMPSGIPLNLARETIAELPTFVQLAARRWKTDFLSELPGRISKTGGQKHC